jgi:hypothetical protein
LRLKYRRAEVAVGTVSAGLVVVDLDILEHGLARGKALAVDAFNLQGLKEALGAGVVVAVALGTLAREQAVTIEQRMVRRRAVRAAPVGMHEHAAGPVALPPGHAQGLVDQIGAHARPWPNRTGFPLFLGRIIGAWKRQEIQEPKRVALRSTGPVLGDG